MGSSLAWDVRSYNPKYADADTFSGATIAAIGAVGLGKSIPTL